MIRADLQSLVSPHHQSRLAILLVLKQPHIASTSFLPLVRLPNEFEKFCAHLKGLLLEFFISFDLNLLREANDGLEVDIF